MMQQADERDLFLSLCCLHVCGLTPCATLRPTCVGAGQADPAFPLAPALRSARSATGSPAASFARFPRYHGGVRLLTTVHHGLRPPRPSRSGPKAMQTDRGQTRDIPASDAILSNMKRSSTPAGRQRLVDDGTAHMAFDASWSSLGFCEFPHFGLPVCGLMASSEQGRVFAVMWFKGDDHLTIQRFKPAWTVPTGMQVDIAIRFDDAARWNAKAVSMGNLSTGSGIRVQGADGECRQIQRRIALRQYNDAVVPDRKRSSVDR